MKQASVLDGFAFDPFSFQQDGLTAPEVDIGRRQIVDALVVAQVIVVGDEGFDPSLELAGQIVVLQLPGGSRKNILGKHAHRGCGRAILSVYNFRARS